MSVAKPRNRLVYFRVSEEEFQKLAGMCHGSDGARSISDLARSAVNRMIADQNREQTFSTVDHKLDTLQNQVQTLTELLTRNPQLRESNVTETANGRPPDWHSVAAAGGGSRE